jgi:hypothetical protein
MEGAISGATILLLMFALSKAERYGIRYHYCGNCWILSSERFTKV